MYNYIFYYDSCIPRIEKAIGTITTSLIQDGVTFLACFIIAMSINWELTLVTSVLLPVIFLIVIALSKVRGVCISLLLTSEASFLILSFFSFFSVC